MLIGSTASRNVIEVIVDAATYRDGRRQSGRLQSHEIVAAAAAASSEEFVWIGLYEPTSDEFDDVARAFDLHPLAVEDAIKAHQRPKVEDYGGMLFVVLKTAHYDDATEQIELGEIQLFVDAHFVVVVRHGLAAELSGVRQELERHPDRLRLGPGAVLHGIVDHVVDRYEPAVDGLEVDLDEVELEVFSGTNATSIERVYKLRREVIELHRGTKPLAQPLERLLKMDHLVVHDEAALRDVHDHVLRIIDRLDGLRDLLGSVLDASLAQVSVRQNEDMRRISAYVAIAAVPTLLAGVWGMNFEHMPELTARVGYPVALGVMFGISLVVHRVLRRAGWL